MQPISHVQEFEYLPRPRLSVFFLHAASILRFFLLSKLHKS